MRVQSTNRRFIEELLKHLKIFAKLLNIFNVNGL